MSKPGYQFENELHHALDDHYNHALVHRLKQNRFTPQEFDLIVIKFNPIFIECKSRDISDRKTLKLSQLFHDEQLKKQLEVVNNTGLQGLLALELRRGRGHAKEAYMLPLSQCNDARIEIEDPSLGVEIEREGSDYQIPTGL